MGVSVLWELSQNRRLAEVGRDFWRLSGPTTLLKQGHPEQVAQDRIQAAFEYLQGWRLHHLSGHPVPGLSHHHSVKVFPDVQREPPVSQFVPIASCPVTGHCWKEPGSVLCAPSLQLFVYVDEVRLRLLISRCSNPFVILVDFLQSVPISLVLGEPSTGLSTPGVASLVLNRGEGSPPRPAGHR